MSDDDQPKQKECPALPGWVMTFADLMSLLLCFFVLLLSFSELDVKKFKQIASSLKYAFGVQRINKKAGEIPKGTSVIAKEFSPGRPSPTPLKEMYQSTQDDSRTTLEFTDALDDNKKINADQMTKVLPELAQEKQADVDQRDSLSAEELEDAAEQLKQQQQQELEDVEEALEEALENEIKEELVTIETQDPKIIIRIREKGTFSSGSADLRKSFVPVLQKIMMEIKDINGNIVVAGHTDPVPIHTARFRSNWDLASARAVTVLHELLKTKLVPKKRFLAEGHADNDPIVANDTPENRAINRRVEIIIIQGDDNEGKSIEDALKEQKQAEEFKQNQEKAEETAPQPNKKAADQDETKATELPKAKSVFERIRQGLSN